MNDKMEEECGVFGVFGSSENETANLIYSGLLTLQHRGQESAGISVQAGGRIHTHRGMGLVNQVFSSVDKATLLGGSGVGHVRYSTSGEKSISNAQPLVGHCKLGDLAVAHNGNLVNADIIRSLMEDGGTVFQTTSDSEIFLNLVSRGASSGSYDKAIREAASAVKGSYSTIILTEDRLAAIRDPYGIRPLCMGKLGDIYIISSETCALDAVGADFIRDIAPGELVFIDSSGIHSEFTQKGSQQHTCLFEYIYFARPDSVIDGISVYQFRYKSGMELYAEYPVSADAVVGVPDSGLAAALGYSAASGIPFRHGLIKNKYSGRSFIEPSKHLREQTVNVKLNVLKSEVEGKRIVLIDDSLVRGTTSKKLIKSLRRAGAAEVHLGIVSPPVTHSCYFGIDTPYRSELIAAGKSTEAICKLVGADSLFYISPEGILKATGKEKGFCMGCFTGIYPMSYS